MFMVGKDCLAEKTLRTGTISSLQRSPMKKHNLDFFSRQEKSACLLNEQAPGHHVRGIISGGPDRRLRLKKKKKKKKKTRKARKKYKTEAKYPLIWTDQVS